MVPFLLRGIEEVTTRGCPLVLSGLHAMKLKSGCRRMKRVSSGGFPGSGGIGSVATHHTSSTLKKGSSEHVGMAWVVLAI
jgi:hypothetical protein